MSAKMRGIGLGLVLAVGGLAVAHAQAQAPGAALAPAPPKKAAPPKAAKPGAKLPSAPGHLPQAPGQPPATVGPTAPATIAPAALPPGPVAPLVGPWAVTYTVEESTCTGVTVGAQSNARWTLSAAKKPGTLTVAERAGNAADPKAWQGAVSDNGAVALRAGKLAIADLTVVSAAGDPLPHLTGQRIVVRGSSCLVVQKIAGERPTDEPFDAGLTNPDPSYTLAAAVAGLPSGSQLTADISTDVGTIRCTLFGEQAPIAVANFVGLARGRRAWKNSKTGHFERGRPFYDGLAFHRLIPGFMIQGGDPASREWDAAQLGSGDAGYLIADDAPSGLRFDKPGVLAMANRGPGTAGSQFFITEVPAPHLDGKNVIFGQCGPIEIIQKAAHAPTDPRTNRPDLPVVIKSVKIEIH